MSLRYDLRRSPEGAPYSELYSAALEQIRWGDSLGFESVTLSEHHFAEDGFLPSPLVLAGAIAGATSRIGISISALLASLHHPLRLAEDLAVLDQLAPGRISAVLGTGYRPIEFEALGIDRAERGARLERAVVVMRQAWTGEPFDFEGVRVQVLPTPVTRGGPMLFVGGSTRIAARRAAKLGANLLPSIDDPQLAADYKAACEEFGTKPGVVVLPNPAPVFVHVTEDPERDWQIIAPHALHDAATYAAWQTPGQRSLVHSSATTVEELRTEGKYRVATPDETIALAQSLGAHATLVLHPLMSGLAPRMAWESLELFAERVWPAIRRGS